MFLSRLLEKRFSRKCYKSIDDLPIFYWDKIHSTGNLSFLVMTKNVQIEVRRKGLVWNIILAKIWRNIIEQYIAKFGFSDQFKEIARIQKQLLKLIEERALNDDRTLTAIIEILKEELVNVQKDSTEAESNFWKIKGLLDKAGYNINPMTTSVTEFYSHFKEAMSVRRAN